MKATLRILIVVVLSLPPLRISARTWYIKADGTGDARLEDTRFGRLQARLLDEGDQEKREEILLALYQDFKMPAFDIVKHSLLADSGMVQTMAANLIGGYYLATPVYPDDPEHLNEQQSEEMRTGRAAVLTQLRALASSDRIGLRLNCLRSLVRMGEADSSVVENLYHMALGDGRERWTYDCESCWGNKSKEEINSHQQKDASGVLSSLRGLGLFRDIIENHLRDVLDRVRAQSRDTPSLAYDLMIEWIPKDLSGEMEKDRRQAR